MEEIVYQSNYELESNYWWFTARAQIIRTLMERYCTGLQPGDTIVDVGCGTGGFLASVADRYTVVGLDVSDTAIAYCRRRGIERLYKGTLEEFSPQGLHVKALLMLDVIEHIDDDRAVVQRAYELLPPGGYLIASVPAYQWLWSTHDELHMHKRRYTRSGFERLLTGAGFGIEKSTYFNSLLFPVAVARRMLEKNKQYQSAHDVVDRVSPGVNKLLHTVFAAESSLLTWMNLPFGLSVFTIARKPLPVAARPPQHKKVFSQAPVF